MTSFSITLRGRISHPYKCLSTSTWQAVLSPWEGEYRTHLNACQPQHDKFFYHPERANMQRFIPGVYSPFVFVTALWFVILFLPRSHLQRALLCEHRSKEFKSPSPIPERPSPIDVIGVKRDLCRTIDACTAYIITNMIGYPDVW